MAQRGSIARGEDRCHPHRVLREHAVADSEDTAMERMQPRAGDPAIDRPTSEPGGEQLCPRYDPVLPGRERSDHTVERSRRTFTITIGANVRLDRHAPMVA